jgi:hypothetical protein
MLTAHETAALPKGVFMHSSDPDGTSVIEPTYCAIF